MIDTSPILWVALVTGLGALVVLVWQTVRYFRNNPGDGGRRGRDDDRPRPDDDGPPA